MMTSERLLDVLSDTMLEGVPQCSDCAFLPYCGADPVFHHVSRGDPVGHKARSDFCEKQTGVLLYFERAAAISPRLPNSRDRRPWRSLH
jgi:sulfatase maturation enzyme AslB (radical SAM superfamily)